MKEFSLDDILSSFDQHKEKLKILFNELKYKRNAKALEADDMIFSNIIEVLLTGDQQMAMIDALGEHFEKSKGLNEVSVLTKSSIDSSNIFSIYFCYMYFIYYFSMPLSSGLV